MTILNALATERAQGGRKAVRPNGLYLGLCPRPHELFEKSSAKTFLIGFDIAVYFVH